MWSCLSPPSLHSPGSALREGVAALVWLGLPGEGPALLRAGRARFTGTLPWDVPGAVCAADKREPRVSPLWQLA